MHEHDYTNHCVRRRVDMCTVYVCVCLWLRDDEFEIIKSDELSETCV